MIYNIEIYFMLFVIYSVLGWVMECTLGVIEKHKFVNRGFLIGPYCPIYGVGVVLVSLALTRFSENILVLFVVSILICGTLEYFTSYIMEKFFNARWWDYSNNKFNINGRICPQTLLPFGVISTILLRYVNPWIFSKLYEIPENTLNILSVVFSIVYTTDILISYNVISKFKSFTKQEKDNTEEITNKVRENAEIAMKKLKIEKQTLVHKINISRLKMLKNIKYTRKKYTKKLKQTPIALVGSFKDKIQNIDNRIRDIRNDLSEKISEIKQNQYKIFNIHLNEKFVRESKLNKRLISAFPNVEHREYTRRKTSGDRSNKE